MCGQFLQASKELNTFIAPSSLSTRGQWQTSGRCQHTCGSLCNRADYMEISKFPETENWASANSVYQALFSPPMPESLETRLVLRLREVVTKSREINVKLLLHFQATPRLCHSHREKLGEGLATILTRVKNCAVTSTCITMFPPQNIKTPYLCGSSDW